VPKNVLVIDDSATIRKAFELTFLNLEEIRMLTSGNTNEAMEIAKREKPELIIVDSKIGDISGYEFCNQIKTIEELKNVPVWIMTGPFERLDDQKYATCGAEGHVRKPFDTQRMIDKVLSMSAPPEEEKGRPSYPAAVAPATQSQVAKIQPPPVASPQAQVIKPASKPAVMSGLGAPKPPAPAAGQSIKTTTLHGQGQIQPPIQPPVGEQSRIKRQPTIMGTHVISTGKGVAQASGVTVGKEKVVEFEKKGVEVEKPAKAGITGEPLFDVSSHKAFLDSLSPKQFDQLMSLIKEVVEKVAWEVVPDLAETIIKEEIERLLKE